MLLCTSTNAFVSLVSGPVRSPPRVTPGLSMILGKKNTEELPRDVKDAVSKCRAAVQEALGSRLSRIDVEMPVGTKFGVEKGGGKSKKKAFIMGGDDENKGVTRDTLEKSDRELARLFVEMFQPLGGDHISVVFNDDVLADVALKNWKGDSAATCRVMSLGRRRRKSKGGMGGGGKKKKKPMGFAAKMAAEIDDTSSGGPFQLPDGTELAMFVAPGPKELMMIEGVCSQLGMDTLVVLLNARLGKISNFGTEAAKDLFLNEFEPVFHLGAAPQEEAPGCLLYRAYPHEWVIARKPKVGQPKPVMSQKERPTAEACREAYESIEVGDMEKGVANVLENVAGWFS